MAKRDFYEILGVARTATDAELKSAFRKTAMECHPDRNPGDKQAEARFKELNEAYQHLSDAQKRAAYDRYGHAAFEQGGGGMGDGFGSSMSDIFDDLFGDIMGAPRARRNPSGSERGADLRYNLEITLEEAFHGKNATIKVPTSRHLRDLLGIGRQGRLEAGDLQDLRGHGRVRAAAGLLRDRAHLPDLPGPRPDHRQSVRPLRRRGPRHARAHAVGQRAGRRRGRHAHPPDRRGRGGPARRRPGRSLHFPVDQAASVLPARRRRSLLPRADLDGSGGARRRIHGAHARRRRCAKCASPRARSPAGSSSCAARACRSCARATSAISIIQVVVETPQNLTRRQRELAGGVRAGILAQDASGKRGLLRQDEGVLRRVGLTAPAAIRALYAGRRAVQGTFLRGADHAKPYAERAASVRLGDRGRFLKSLVGSPRLTGAVAPSGQISRARWRGVGPPPRGLIVELGPGTGPVTKALIAAWRRSASASCSSNTIPVSAACSKALRRRPRHRGRRLRSCRARFLACGRRDRRRRLEPAAAQPAAGLGATKLLDDAFALMGPGGVFVQFTYGLPRPFRMNALTGRYAALAARRSGATCRRPASGPIALDGAAESARACRVRAPLLRATV